MELTWLVDSPQSRSRLRALKACSACQQRKKRCRHINSNSELSETYIRPLHTFRGDHDLDRSQATRNTTYPYLANHPITERFVGDLNPEAFIRENLDEPTGIPRRDHIGLWIPRNQQTTGSDSISTQSCQSSLNSGVVTSLLHDRYSFAMRACDQLPTSTREPLTAIYFSKVNHIVPLLEQHQTTELASVFLKRAICLVAAKDPTAASYLRLVKDGPLLSVRQFCSEVYKGLRAAMDAELEPDRLTRIRVLALMSLHCEGYDGAETASLHLCHAIHQAQTIGLHLDRPDRTSAEPLVRLFWSLWTLDKMHASIGGRPVLLADRDIGITTPTLNDRKTLGAFGVWLAISDLLATVISYYRPSATNTSGWEEGFPPFEDIVAECSHGSLNFAILGFLELYYQSVAILSCRRELTDHSDGTKISSIRQGLAAIRIQSIVASECSGDLPPLPIVAYAISLSMGVSYRQLRSSKLITHFNRAKTSLEECCSLLEELSSPWYAAEAMARLGRKALQQIDYRPTLPVQQTENTSLIDRAPGFSNPNEIPSVNHINNDSTMPLPTAEISMASDLPSINDTDISMQKFTDIDILFGEFLDLSLPTNFWDPIFAFENGGSQS
ncbi:transcriptional regulator family: Fungal Specific TF [Penicillium taxi]|uniref:transcriptional regulator family: Fungal Specific TF n=1 Tax=Penicillium taxi TaxID=168475 RepID=UPI002544F3A4|nr:transcriptional regulator family: Fungal Specific TF [Penicillium taxi]KAJ5894445.1 transcriptional regulator family: Fungal Specific TF [Penicillium taxi]